MRPVTRSSKPTLLSPRPTVPLLFPSRRCAPRSRLNSTKLNLPCERIRYSRQSRDGEKEESSLCSLRRRVTLSVVWYQRYQVWSRSVLGGGGFRRDDRWTADNNDRASQRFRCLVRGYGFDGRGMNLPSGNFPRPLWELFMAGKATHILYCVYTAFSKSNPPPA